MCGVNSQVKVPRVGQSFQIGQKHKHTIVQASNPISAHASQKANEQIGDNFICLMNYLICLFVKFVQKNKPRADEEVPVIYRGIQ